MQISTVYYKNNCLTIKRVNKPATCVANQANKIFKNEFVIWSFPRVTPKGEKNKLCNKIKCMKGALNANINVCILSINEIDNKFFFKSKY